MNAPVEQVDRIAIADVLERAADLIEPEGAWRQHGMAGLPDGKETGARDPRAVCFCVGGAIIRVADSEAVRQEAIKTFRQATAERSVVDYNDARKRTQYEVVAKLREVATAIRSPAHVG